MSKETRTGGRPPVRGASLLVVDDEPKIARVIGTLFEREGWDVQAFQNPEEALEALKKSEVDVVVSDLSMPQMTGTELLTRMREHGILSPLLVVTAFGSVDSAVEALKLGAFDYLCKPFELEQVKLAVQRAYLHSQLQKENQDLRKELQAQYSFGSFVGASPKMREVYSVIEKAARSHATVLILGESGTGKELVARALHYSSARANKRFVPVSCAALPNELLESELFGHEKGAFTGANWQRLGRFELADGGTLFLDEIGDIGLNVQTKLLRVLQEREIDRVGGTKPVKVDVRLVSATNRDLPEAIEKGQFREDLYYRLRVIELRLPALRERREDIPLLVKHFVEKFSKREGRKLEGVSAEALALLEDYDWPGNVRELEHVIEHATVMAEEDAKEIGARLLPANLRGSVGGWEGGRVGGAGNGKRGLNEALAEVERRMILEALEESGWDLNRAAESLGVPFRSICQSVRKHNLAKDRRPLTAA